MTLPDQIYGIFTKRRYSRGVPYKSESVLRQITVAVQKDTPIRLIGFWGVGSKAAPNWADKKSCLFLDELNQEIKDLYSPGIQFTFVFAKPHGLHNGYAAGNIDTYIQGMQNLFKEYGFKYLELEPLWHKYNISFDIIERVVKEKEQGWWKKIPEHELIERNATHRNIRLDPLLAAQHYFIMRDLEKKIFETEFSNSIFHAFSDPDLHVVLPDMPTLYFYGRESWSNAPWFVDYEKKQ